VQPPPPYYGYPPPYGPYGPPVPPYDPPPPRSTNIVLIVVVVVVVIVAVTIVLSAILYFAVSGLIGGPPPNPRPIVSLGAVTLQGQNATFAVVSASQARPLGLYNVNLLVNTTTGTPRPLTPAQTVIVGGDAYGVSFFDRNGDGLLDTGDGFIISAPGAWRAGATYQFMILWTDNAPVGFRNWTT